ncbi:MAG: NADH-quinone oxidoreductase subunit J [Pseudomonadota bacterium]
MLMDALAFYLFSAVILGSAVMVITARNPVHSVFFLILAFFNAAGLFVLMRAEFLAMMLVVVYVGAIAVLFLFVVMMLEIKQPTTRKPLIPKMRAFALSFSWFLAYVLVAAIFIAATVVLITLLTQQLTAQKFDFSRPDSITAVIVFCSLVLGGVLTELFFTRVCHRSWRKIFDAFCRKMPMGVLVLSLLLAEALVVTRVWLRGAGSEEVLMAPTPPDTVLSNTHALGQLIYTDYVYVFQTVGLVLLVAMIGAIVLTLRRRPDVKRQDVRTQIYRSPKEAVEIKTVESGQGIDSMIGKAC